MKRNTKMEAEAVKPAAHKIDYDIAWKSETDDNSHALKMVKWAMQQPKQANPPRCGGRALEREIQKVLMRGGGTPSARAQVAVGLIEDKVRKAYKITA